MRSFFSWPIRRHLLLLVFLAVLPALGIILYSGLELRRHAMSDTRRDLVRLTDHMAGMQDNFTDQARHLFDTLTTLPAIHRRDAKACDALFATLLRRIPHYANLMALDPAGNVFASAVPFKSITGGDRKYFRDAVATRGFSAGEYAVSRTTGRPAIHFASPAYDGKGALRAMVVAAFDLGHFERIFAREGMPEDSVLLVIDHAGVVLHDSRVPSRSGNVTGEKEILDALRGPVDEGSFQAVPTDGIRRLFAYRRLRTDPSRPPYLLMAVGFPESRIVSTPRKVLMRNLGFLGLAALFAAAAAWIVGNAAIVNRARSLVSASEKLGKGDLSARTGLPRTEGELGLLAAAFDEMAHSLETREKRQREAEDALRVSEEKYRAVVEHANDGIFVAQDGFIKFPNPRLSGSTGYSPEELTSVPFPSFIHPEDRGTVIDNHRKRLSGEDAPDKYSFRVISKSGETLWMEIRPVLISWEGRPGTLNILRDITREKKLEAQLLHAQKMEAVGTLAGGIAHDFNNLLQAISGFAVLTLQELPEGDARRSYVKNIERAAGRASDLVRSLLTFSRRGRSQQVPLDLNREVEHTAELLERIIPKMIRIETRLAAELPPILGDPVRIEQVIMNLGTNARDAMPEGGRLLIETETRSVGAGDGRLPPDASPGTYVVLRVSDTGQGMDARTAAKMFDPFFTTKAVGAGTGLGLSTVYGIVRSHGGWILCESEPGRGTRFEIFLPPSGEKVASTGEEIPSRECPPGGSGRILLVDDDEMLRDLGKRVLEAGDLDVRTAGSGEEALDLFGADGGGFDLVVLDLGMPGMGGRKCLEAMKRIKPSVKVLVVSGYSEERQPGGIVDSGAAGFVAKPYSPQGLLRTVRGIIGD